LLRLYREGAAEVLVEPPEEGLWLQGDDFYKVGFMPEEWAGLHVLRPGWWRGSMQGGRFTPDHGLAMGLRPEQAQQTISLVVGDPRLGQFLTGGNWADEGTGGWVLVTVEGFPLGWGRRSGGRLRSMYPSRLRQAPRWE
jgi:NOL1/NOP2/fmu family ribosome biogenesis protein